MQQQTGLKVVFAGTPDFAERHLSALIHSHHRVVSVYTQPDRPAGRGKKLQASSVKQLAIDSAIEVQQPVSLKNEQAQQIFKAYNADILVVVAYGLLLPQAILDTPRLGCINVHASILPRWRGAAPIQRAIEAGDTETGITIMQMDIGLDTGDMLNKVFCPIFNDDTASSLHDRLAEIGPDALLATLDQLAQGTTTAVPQDHDLATYAHKLNKHEAQLNWLLPATELDRRIRAFNPYPIATTQFQGETIRIHRAHLTQASHNQAPGTIMDTQKGITVACGQNGAICIDAMQLPGKKALSCQEILNGSGAKFQAGAVFVYEQSNE